jgi:hypothetical protein
MLRRCPATSSGYVLCRSSLRRIISLILAISSPANTCVLHMATTRRLLNTAAQPRHLDGSTTTVGSHLRSAWDKHLSSRDRHARCGILHIRLELLFIRGRGSATFTRCSRVLCPVLRRDRHQSSHGYVRHFSPPHLNCPLASARHHLPCAAAEQS